MFQIHVYRKKVEINENTLINFWEQRLIKNVTDDVGESLLAQLVNYKLHLLLTAKLLLVFSLSFLLN